MCSIQEAGIKSISVFPVSYTQLLDSPSAAALIAEYEAECSIPEIGHINPQADIYGALERLGVMQCFGAFNGGALAGFASVLTTMNPHYGKKLATLESLFIAQEHRSSGLGALLMQTVEQYARESGCVGILYSAPAGGQLELLLDLSKPYRRTNAVFYRRFE